MSIVLRPAAATLPGKPAADCTGEKRAVARQTKGST